MLDYNKKAREKIKEKINYFDDEEEKIIDCMLIDYGHQFLDEISQYAKETTWMADTESVMKEDIINDEIDGLDDLIATFEDGWQETDNFRFKVCLPIYNKVSDAANQVLPDNIDSEYKSLTISEMTFEIIKEIFWEPYHKYHNSYEIGRKLLKESLTK
jgi:hypothetical protein